MTTEFDRDIAAVNDIAVVPKILEVICRTTGMGFSAVARVTDDRWIACQVLDHLGFGLEPGGELKIESTLCHGVRQQTAAIIIEDVTDDPIYRDHHTPALYRLKSYISVPIVLPDGRFFGTLCAIDPKPAKLKTPQNIAMFELFADLIGLHLAGDARMQAVEDRLALELEEAKVREQFIAVLGHDLRNPLAAIDAGATRLLRDGFTERTPTILRLMKLSTLRMRGLIDNVLDLARSRLGGGLAIEVQSGVPLEPILEQVLDEIRLGQPDHTILANIEPDLMLDCDPVRISQLFSNLLGNAVTHDDKDRPVYVMARTDSASFILEVANSGTAIPEDARASLFLPFKRGSSGQGVGLGLYIASQIAQAHSGWIDLHSDDRETRFRFRMPMRLGEKTDTSKPIS